MRKLAVILISLSFSMTALACASKDKKEAKGGESSVENNSRSQASYERHLQMLERVDNIR